MKNIVLKVKKNEKNFFKNNQNSILKKGCIISNKSATVYFVSFFLNFFFGLFFFSVSLR